MTWQPTDFFEPYVYVTCEKKKNVKHKIVHLPRIVFCVFMLCIEKASGSATNPKYFKRPRPNKGPHYLFPW